jgi:D-beta-D-heptose 7-phosphate kinase/D-beta-D-heptose 1-phosphate adenosyltransferase
VIGARQQLARLDTESDAPLNEAVERKIISNSAAAIDDCDLVVLSDYGKGVLNDRVLASIFELAAASGKKVIVDPKRSDFSAYRGAAILTPNRSELSKAIGMACDSDEEAQAAAAAASERSGADIVLTRSEKGMSFLSRQGDAIHLPTVAREVFDVSGAGDTVVAILATALAAGGDIVSAMKIANHAAGIVVGKAGTATLTRAELMESLDAADLISEADGHLATLREACHIREAWRSKNYTVGVANGCFDLLHPGHISLIRQAGLVCDRLIIALNTDASVGRLKGPTRPVQKQLARADVVGGIKGVALVVFFDEDTPLKLIEALRPDVLIKGKDYLGKEVVGSDIVESYGGKVFLARLVEEQSTTRLIKAAQ